MKETKLSSSPQSSAARKNPTKSSSKKPSNSKQTEFSADDVFKLVISSLEASKAEDIVPIDIHDKSALADFMVVASGTSHRHIGSTADHLIRALKEAGFGAPKVEGLTNCDWVLVDTGDVIVHLFRPEVREFYNLEKMWMMPEE